MAPRHFVSRPAAPLNRPFENTLPGLDDKAVPLTGRAGTLAVVDTDVPHKAGKVIGAKARKVIRIDTTSPSYSGFEWKRQPKGGFFSRIMRSGGRLAGMES